MGNAYRSFDGTWDRQYLRTCAVYRALSRGWVTREEARELAMRPMRRRKPLDISGTIDMWTKNPRKEFDGPQPKGRAEP